MLSRFPYHHHAHIPSLLPHVFLPQRLVNMSILLQIITISVLSSQTAFSFCIVNNYPLKIAPLWCRLWIIMVFMCVCVSLPVFLHERWHTPTPQRLSWWIIIFKVFPLLGDRCSLPLFYSVSDYFSVYCNFKDTWEK